MVDLIPCPICEKAPKVKYEYNPCGCFIKIICKKRFGKNKHELMCECGAASEKWCYEKVSKQWNSKVYNF